METWDPVAFKTLLRTTSQRLGQLQERKDSQCQLTRHDIATHLFQGHLALARAKAATLIQEDVMGDLIEELEMLVGVVASHVGELATGRTGVGLGLVQEVNVNGAGGELGRVTEGGGGRVGDLTRLHPVLVEAAASIIHTAPTIESKDLNVVRDILIQRLGLAFAQTASGTWNNHVSPRIMQILSSPTPTASKMDEYLLEIAHTYGVKWVPEPRRGDLLNVISEILRVDGSSPIVDLPRLREICARGLPDNPPWIRPRVWRLLFGTLPVLKTRWTRESRKQRDSYYDLVRRLLTPLASLPSPTDPLSPTDVLLTRISDALFRVSPELFVLLGNEPKSVLLGKCPLDPTAPDAIRIACASNLDKRLTLLRGDADTSETPEIRLESDLNSSPDPASPLASATATMLASRPQCHPTTLLPSKPYNAPPAHRAHLSALVRLLYIHSSLNPAVQSPHVPWLLVPLYSALVGETNEDDATHAEADTFWVFEALVGEIAEMEEEDGGKVWTRKLSEQVKWADGELAMSLHTTGLDPALPHYSYRWLAPLLAQTLPLSSVLPIWDVLFARPMRTRDRNPKLEHLVDICTALLIRARTPLSRLGKPARNVPGLWSREHASLPPLSPLRPWELGDAFTEGIALLTSYPIDAAGGIDRILQTASDLAQKRVEAEEREKERKQGNVGFGTRIKIQIWKGFTNQVADAGPEEEVEEEEEEEEEEEKKADDAAGEHDDGDETETPAAPSLTSRLANTVWRGITNQSSMDDEIPSPPSPLSEEHLPISTEERDTESLTPNSTPSPQTSLWGYAGKLKDSDTVAAFSKVSTNWRAKALEAWRVHKGNGAPVPSVPVLPQPPPSPSAVSEIIERGGWPGLNSEDPPSRRRGSLPRTQRESEGSVQDPPRPAFFRSPRESFLPQPRRQHATAPPTPNGSTTPRDSDAESSASSIFHRAGTSLASLAAFPPSQTTPKSVPRPLMLNSRDLITTKTAQPRPHSSARSEGSSSEYRSGASVWADVSLAATNRHALRQASVSSTSSLSPSEAMTKSPYAFSRARSAGTGPRSDYESDESAAATSRRVALNRKSVSPMALASRSPRLPWNGPLSSSSPGTRSPGHPLSNGSVTAEEVGTASEGGWKPFERHCQVPATTDSMMAGLDSPTTIGSPPIPRTPVMSAVIGPGMVRIVHGEHVGTSSVSTLSEVGVSVSEANAVPLEPPAQSRHVVRRKTPPLPVPTTTSLDVDADGEISATESEPSLMSESGASEVSLERTPVGKAPVRIRTKRYRQRPGSLRLRPSMTGMGVPDQRRTPSPGQANLTPDWLGEYEQATTPKMENYSGRTLDAEDEEDGVGGVLSSPRPPITRKLSKEARLRKISTGSREMRCTRESGAEEGDDEGYDELLSAYESEDGSQE